MSISILLFQLQWMWALHPTKAIREGNDIRMVAAIVYRWSVRFVKNEGSPAGKKMVTIGTKGKGYGRTS